LSLESLYNTSAKIIYCSGVNGKEEYEKWASINQKYWHKDIIFNSNWLECFDDCCSHFNLNQRYTKDETSNLLQIIIKNLN